MKQRSIFFFILISISIFSIPVMAQWKQVLDLPTHKVTAIVKSGNKYFAGTSGGNFLAGSIYSSTDEGDTWSIVNTGFTISGVFSMAVRDSFIYVGTYEHAMLMSTNYGNSWYLNGVNGVWKLGVFGVGIYGNDNVILYTNHGSGLEFSTNKGMTFSPMTVGAPITLLQVFKEVPSVFAGSCKKGIALSSNGGVNWSLQANNGLESYPDGSKPIRAMQWFNNKLFVGCINKVYYSDDNGVNFIPTNYQLTQSWEYYSCFLSRGSKLYAGIYKLNTSPVPGIIVTTDNGASWSSYQDNGFPGRAVASLLYSDKYMMAGTYLSGIWVRAIEGNVLHLGTGLEAINQTDTITVELRSSVAPFNVIETKKGLGGTGTLRDFEFLNAVNDVDYYLAVKHRNSIQTWSSFPLSFLNDEMIYNFTSSETQAFGSNMVNKNGIWNFFSGDVNQEGSVNLADGTIIKNSATSFQTGYKTSDLNYDNVVNLADINIWYNNSAEFVKEYRP